MDQAGERPQREQQHRHEDVHLERRGDPGHERGLRLQVPQRTEPGGDGLPVVVAVAAGEDLGLDGRPGARQERAGEEHVHGLVHARGREEHGPGRAAPVDEDEQPGHGDDRRGRAHRRGDEVVEALRDADRLGPRLRDHQAEEVPEDDEEQPVVEQRRAVAQEALLVQLAGPGGPAELVVAVPPDRPHHQHGEGHVRHDHPEDDPVGTHVHVSSMSVHVSSTAGRPRSRTRSAPRAPPAARR